MRISKISKLIIKNYSSIISNQEIKECIKLLPIEYRNVRVKVFIYDDFKEYLYFCIKNMRVIDLISTIYRRIFEKIKKDNIDQAFYERSKKEIHVFQDKIRESISFKKKSFEELDDWKYVSDEIWNRYEAMWIKYITIYDLIHEINHAIQFNEKKFTVRLKDIIKKWDDRKYEIDAVKTSEAIYKKLDEDFIKILKAEGIHVYHQYEGELYIGFKYNITYKKSSN